MIVESPLWMKLKQEKTLFSLALWHFSTSFSDKGKDPMKKNTGNNIRLGMFISIGIALFIAGIYFVGEKQQLFRSTFRLHGVFKDVGGLQAGNNVRLLGVNVGTIDNISVVSDTTVNVEIVIDENARKFIKKDAVASIGSEGLIGNKVLIINPGTGDKAEIENLDAIQTVQPINLDNILISLKKTADNASNITNNLSDIANNIQSGKGTIGRLLMDHSMAQNFDSTLFNLKEGSVDFKNLIDEAKSGFSQNIDSAITNLDSILVSLKITSDNASNITGDLSEITDNIQSGKGSIGMLLKDRSIALKIDSTLVNMNAGLKNFTILMKEAKNSWMLWGF